MIAFPVAVQLYVFEAHLAERFPELVGEFQTPKFFKDNVMEYIHEYDRPFYVRGEDKACWGKGGGVGQGGKLCVCVELPKKDPVLAAPHAHARFSVGIDY